MGRREGGRGKKECKEENMGREERSRKVKRDREDLGKERRTKKGREKEGVKKEEIGIDDGR